MKCPECSFDQKVKYGLKCGHCGYQFTFNPKDSSTFGMTDGKFFAHIRKANQNGTAHFTQNQLYAAFCGSGSQMQYGCLVFGAVFLVAGIAAAFAVGNGMVMWVAAFLFLVAAAISFISAFSQPRTLEPDDFQRLIKRWRADKKPIDNLIEKPSLHQRPPEWNEPDIYDYGVERLLIVEHDILVDLFVKNDVHANERMLVLAESGYPDYLLPVAERLLREQPDLPVFLLHDATDHGLAMEGRVLAAGRLPLDGHPITDLGMFPTDFQKLKRTRRIDASNTDRELPVDALMLPFLTMGLGIAMTDGIALGAMIEDQTRGGTGNGGYDFG